MRLPVLLWLAVFPISAQWLNLPTPGIPRTRDGKPNLTAPAPRAPGGKPDLSGLWSTPSDRFYSNIAADLNPADVLPWAAALSNQRMRDFSKDSMETLCLPLGPASMTGPFRDFRIVQTPAIVVILFNDLTHRQVFLDGRKLEKNPNPTWMGYSVGHWEGDTLVVESNGYTPRVWLDWDGHPHTEDLRITERFRRLDMGNMEIRMTLDDPKAYAKPWTVVLHQELMVDTEMLEHVCSENERDRLHMDAKGPEISEAGPAPGLSRFLGSYEFVDGGRPQVGTVTVSNGTLFWDQNGTGKQRLLPLSDGSFSLSGTVFQFASGTGTAEHILMQWAEGEIKATRRN